MNHTTLDLTPELVRILAPTGVLRAAINVGNPILANLDPAGQPVGVSIDMAGGLAEALGVGLKMTVFKAAAASVDAVTNQQCDIGFFAIDPVRGAGIDFTAAYVVIEGAYLVRNESRLKTHEEVDVPGHRVAVAKGSAYDLFLTREMKNATLVHTPFSSDVVNLFIEQNLDVAAGVKQQMEADALRVSGLRLLPGHFMLIQQAMGLPKGRPPEALALLRRYVEMQKASGFVAASLARHGIEGAAVASSAPD
ncbi:cystine transporter subunit [Variovorax sp. PBS-H4]|uniref:ABC transporter substrate-binding protein n=1 Tax=Variovorax sp. PBS-H4 TaxID=434008 RepID=UPI0013195415|nr:ABC transporter substrate-binding protein [Variovorax sp. PBS-H4]VTU36575.1 cystine transporter subunit [Variovorax sp. PBS-H4]